MKKTIYTDAVGKKDKDVTQTLLLDILNGSPDSSGKYRRRASTLKSVADIKFCRPLLQCTNEHKISTIMEIDDNGNEDLIGPYTDTKIWLLVVIGILLFFPVGCIAFFYLYTARIQYHIGHITDAFERAGKAKLISFVAISIGILWIGLLIGITLYGPSV